MIIPIVLGIGLIAFLAFKSSDENLFEGINQEWLPGENPKDYVVRFINEVRAREGIAPLTHVESYNTPCIFRQNQDFAISQIPHRLFGICGEKAQNQCIFYAQNRELIGNCLNIMYAEGPGADFEKHGHYYNMINPDFNQIAVLHFGNVLTMNFH